MATYDHKSADRLKHLVAIANDGKYGYQNAAENVNDITLKQLFQQYSIERARYAEDLNKEVTRAGGLSEQGGGPLGELHRTWMDIKSAFTDGDRESILNTCITGEEAAVKAFEDALESGDLPVHARALVSQQLGGIKFALNSIRSLAESVKA